MPIKHIRKDSSQSEKDALRNEELEKNQTEDQNPTSGLNGQSGIGRLVLSLISMVSLSFMH